MQQVEILLGSLPTWQRWCGVDNATAARRRVLWWGNRIAADTAHNDPVVFPYARLEPGPSEHSLPGLFQGPYRDRLTVRVNFEDDPWEDVKPDAEFRNFVDAYSAVMAEMRETHLTRPCRIRDYSITRMALVLGPIGPGEANTEKFWSVGYDLTLEGSFVERG